MSIALAGSEKFAQVVQRIDPRYRLIRAWKLKGGISAEVTALEIEQANGQTQKMVVRQYSETDLKQNLHVAANEFRLLRTLRSTGLAVPDPYYLDQSGDIFPTPYIVIEYVEGKPEFSPADLPDFIFQFTSQLSRIHAVNRLTADLSFLPQQKKICAEELKEQRVKFDEISEEDIQNVSRVIQLFPQQNPAVLLHGDFWPGNILWKGERLVAIIDWEDARLGDPLADVANSRLEILWAFGREAMYSFTRQYQSMTAFDLTCLPCWDLYAALRVGSQFAEWATDDAIRQTMLARHRWFLLQACEQISHLDRKNISPDVS
ncbi:MAG: phosphotransferase family protein [Ktedonobacteraceae bacterium]|nr:phosphotransferase family protein [Ktedonobacteraceae bacterium]